VIIPINEKYRIKSETHSWNIQKRVSIKKIETKKTKAWKNIQFYNSLENALQGLLNLQIREIQGSNIQQINKKIDEYQSQIKEAFKKFSTVNF